MHFVYWKWLLFVRKKNPQLFCSLVFSIILISGKPFLGTRKLFNKWFWKEKFYLYCNWKYRFFAFIYIYIERTRSMLYHCILFSQITIFLFFFRKKVQTCKVFGKNKKLETLYFHWQSKNSKSKMEEKNDQIISLNFNSQIIITHWLE